MASSYPGSLDSFDSIASDKKTSDVVGGRTHRDMHNDLGDAIEAVQAELGTDPAGAYATVKARFEAIEGATLPAVDAKGDLIVGTADNTYDNLTVGTNDTVLVADSAQTKGVKWAQVPTAGIADSAVTSAKIADGTIVNADVSSSAAIDPSKISNLGNLLTANQASATDTSSDTTGFTASGATLSSSTTTPHQGSRCLLATATNANARTMFGGDTTAGTIAVTGGEVYTVFARLLSATVTKQVRLRIYWWTSAGNVAASTASTSGSAVTLSTSWQEAQLTATAPSNAAFASLAVLPVSGDFVSSDTYAVDTLGFWLGVGGRWAMPGPSIKGQAPILVSPNGTKYTITVDNAGALSSSAL